MSLAQSAAWNLALDMLDLTAAKCAPHTVAACGAGVGGAARVHVSRAPWLLVRVDSLARSADHSEAVAVLEDPTGSIVG